MEKKGFTLIEVMIVMAIIAILVGMILPRFKGIQDQGKITRAQGEIRTLKTALESYYIRFNAWPVVITTTRSTLWQAPLLASQPQLISAVLNDPFLSAPVTQYSVARSLNAQYYIIWSVGPNGVTTITGISNAGAVTGAANDDVWTSNAQ